MPLITPTLPTCAANWCVEADCIGWDELWVGSPGAIGPGSDWPDVDGNPLFLTGLGTVEAPGVGTPATGERTIEAGVHRITANLIAVDVDTNLAFTLYTTGALPSYVQVAWDSATLTWHALADAVDVDLLVGTLNVTAMIEWNDTYWRVTVDGAEEVGAWTGTVGSPTVLLELGDVADKQFVGEVIAECVDVDIPCSWDEMWPYPAGIVPDPPWDAPFGAGTEIVSTGLGSATSGAGASAGTRLHDEGLVWGYTGSIIVDDVVVTGALTAADGGFVSQLGVEWDSGGGNWDAVTPGGHIASGHVGTAATFTFQWNSVGDWSVIIGSEPAVTGVGMIPIPGGFVLAFVPAAAPSVRFGAITSICDELPVP